MSPLQAEQAKQDQQKNRIRVRNNQRNARARRQNYVKELERKWSECVQLGARANAEMQLAARKVAVENTFLKDLLRQRGLDEETLATQIRLFWQSRSECPALEREALPTSESCATIAGDPHRVSDSASANIHASPQAPENESQAHAGKLPQMVFSDQHDAVAELPTMMSADSGSVPSLAFDDWLNDLYDANGVFNEDFENALDSFMAADMISGN